MTSEDLAPDEDRSTDSAAAIAECLAEGDFDAAIALAHALHPAELARTLAGMDRGLRALLLVRLHPDELSELMIALPDDLATNMVQSLPRVIAEGIVASLSRRAHSLHLALAAYPPDTAAGRMTGQIFTVSPTYTISQTIKSLRAQRPEARRPFYPYVVDWEGRLVGTVEFSTLLFASPESRVIDIASEPVSVRADTDQEEAARLLKQHKVLALPVVDEDVRLLGAFTIDDTLDVLEGKATEDMLRLAGVSEEEGHENVLDSVRNRLPWLAFNLAALILAAWVIALFESTIASAAVLAVFLPVVLGQGGNGGLQTVTVVVRSLALGRIAPRNTPRIAVSEMTIALITGGAIGATVGLLAWIWKGNPWLGLIVGVAILGNQLVGAVAGVCFPMGLQLIRQDPAVSAPIWLTNATDVLGAIGLLALATLLISHL